MTADRHPGTDRVPGRSDPRGRPARSFGYTAGWNPYAADYSRYLPVAAAKRAGVFAGLGNFASSTVLQVAGAAAVTAVGVGNWNGANPVGSYISLMPAWLGGVTLLAIFIGAISANALNLYSAAMSFAALGVALPTAFARAVIAVIVGPAGLVVAMAVSIALFSNQQLYVGVLATAFPAIGDITFEVEFVLAVALYPALRPVLARRAAPAA